MKTQLILLILIFSVVKADNPLQNYTPKFERSNILINFQSDSLTTDSTNQQRSILNKKIVKASLMSALLPGTGQWYNGSPAWKTAVLAGVEVIGLYQYWRCQNSAEDLKIKYERYADENWDITRWALNTATLRSYINSIENIVIDDLHITGTHNILLYIDGKYVSSDTLRYNPGMSVEVVKNRDYYENIGKYDQFVAGWSDALTEWYIKEKDVGSAKELIVLTPLKKKYLNKRKTSNDFLKMANFALSTVLLNHVISVIDLWIFPGKMEQAGHGIDTRLGVIINSDKVYNVNGLSIVWTF